MNKDYQSLLRAVEKKLGRSLVSASDFEYLAKRLNEETHESLSVSTLMRLWGYSKGVTPHKSTLDILSRFLGYNDSVDYFASLQPKETLKEKTPDENAKKSSRKWLYFILTAVILAIGGIIAVVLLQDKEQAPRRILKLSELSNTKQYIISSQHGLRGKLGVIDHQTATTYELAQRRRCLKPGHFAILQYEGDYYLYSVDDNRFVNAFMHEVDAPLGNQALKFKLVERDSCFVFGVQMTNSVFTLNLNTHEGTIFDDYGLTSDDYDEGNMLEVYEDGDFDPTEPLQRIKQMKTEAERARRQLTPETIVCVYTLKDAAGREGKKPYYLSANGRLTDTLTDSCRFALHSITGDSLYVSPSFRLCLHEKGKPVPQGCRQSFTFVKNGNDQRKHPTGHLETMRYDSDLYNGQVFFLGDNGCYAIRCTCTPVSHWFSGAFWCVVDADKDGSPDIDYSAERQYVWRIKPL